MNKIFKRLSVWFLTTGTLMVLVPMLLLGTAKAQDYYPGDIAGINTFCKSVESIDSLRDTKTIKELESLWDEFQSSKECAMLGMLFVVEILEHVYTFVDSYGTEVEIYIVKDTKNDMVFAIHRVMAKEYSL